MELTKEEKAWVKKVNKILSQCPSTRLGFASMGDPSIYIFDVTRLDEIYEQLEDNKGDFIPSAQEIGAVSVECIEFPSAVESTAG